MSIKTEIRESSSTIANTVLVAVFSFVMRNLEFIPLCFALQYWFNAGNSWKYWITILLVAIGSGISTAYHKRIMVDNAIELNEEAQS
jgi:hypothetical protein